MTGQAEGGRLHLQGGRVIDPSAGVDRVTDLFIADGRIVALDSPPDGFVPDRVIDAAGLVVAPGLVDLAAHPREPGAEHKATLASESHAAAAGGITTLCCPPDMDPVIDTPAAVELVRTRSEKAGRVRVVPVGALTKELAGEQVSELSALKLAGCAAVGNGRWNVNDTLVMRRALEYAATHDLTVILQPEDPWLASCGCMHEGAVSLRLGLTGIPVAAETAAVARDLSLVEQAGARAHFGRLSSRRAVEMIAEAQARGLPITADVAVHHLYLTEIDVSGFNSNCHVRPPLRTLRDKDGLREAVAQGVVGAVCSDHQPHEADAKLAPFAETAPGISGLETLLPLTLRLVADGVLSLAEALARVTFLPARALGLAAGTLDPGARADLCVFDPDYPWEFDPSEMISAGHNSPFGGWPLTGRTRYTILGGRIVHEWHPREALSAPG